MNEIYLLAINLTRRCNLRCAHCYLDAETLQHGTQDELSTQEVSQLLDDIASRNTETLVVLTGGEPLLRHDLESLIKHGHQLGLFMVIGTNGVLLTEKRVVALKAVGAMGIGISIDSLKPEQHDAFRGCPGAWEKTLAGIDACRKHELSFQVHFSVTEENANEIPAMIAFARASDARVLNLFFLVCTGRGERMTNITAATYEQVLNQIMDAQDQSENLIIRARCAPHFQRIAHQHKTPSLTRTMGYDGSSCIAGSHYCRITPEGGITACPYIPDEVGNLRQHDFLDVWDHNSVFQQLRSPQLNGKCGQCEYQKLCGGCRARALAVEGDLMAADNWCSYTPQDGDIIPVYKEQASSITWSDEAQQRLSRIPAFLRKMVKKRAEDFVQQTGETEVTATHLHSLAARRFGKQGPPKPPANIIPFSSDLKSPRKDDKS